MAHLHELEAQLRTIAGAWNRYRWRVWQQCRSMESAGVEERYRIASEVLADPHRGEWTWAVGSQHMMVVEIATKVDDLDPHVRADAIVALAALGTQSRQFDGRLLARIDSPDASLHEKTLAAWALPRIGFKEGRGVQMLLQNLELHPGPDAAELRVRLAEAIEFICNSFRVLVPLARRLLADEQPSCRLHGLQISGRLLHRDRRLWSMLRPSVESLRDDERDELRLRASRILEELQS